MNSLLDILDLPPTTTISRAVISQDEVIVIETDKMLSKERVEEIHTILKRVFARAGGVLVLTGGMKMKLVKK